MTPSSKTWKRSWDVSLEDEKKGLDMEDEEQKRLGMCHLLEDEEQKGFLVSLLLWGGGRLFH
jgi:hypothetical protein